MSAVEKTDVLIVGSGFGGSIAAYHLAAGGAKVTVLERGPWLEGKDFDHDYLLGKSYTRVFDFVAGDGMSVLGGNWVGGGSVDSSECDPGDVPPLDLRGATALIHSRRAALRLAELTPREERSHIALVAISAAAAEAAGDGWRQIDVSDRPEDAAMIERALTAE